MTGSLITIDWHGRPVDAWLPAQIAATTPALNPATMRKARAATQAALSSRDQLSSGWEPLARLLLRAEGISSSQIEDLRPPVTDVLAAEIDPTIGGDAAWVANNLSAVLEALRSVAAPMTVGSLHGWHALLMQGTNALPPTMIGSLRQSQGWVGGDSPLTAAHVPPPADALPELMEDLIGFVNRDDVEPTVQAAIAHAQFESIHPYADGNGRLGRILISWILARRLALTVPPAISVRLAASRGEYISGLTGYRVLSQDTWVSYFAEALEQVSGATNDLLDGIRQVTESWAAQLTDIRDVAAARRAIDPIAAHPVMSAALLSNQLEVSERSARTALDQLAQRGIVTQYTGRGQRRGRPAKLWVATEVIDLIRGWHPY